MAQYCSDLVANDTSRTTSPHSGHASPGPAVDAHGPLLVALELGRLLADGARHGLAEHAHDGGVQALDLVGSRLRAGLNGDNRATWRISSE